jgi:glucosyl-3-phosphoglycerate synthase
VPFVQGYGVDLGLLVDVSRLVGLPGLAQVDLGTRVHRNRPLEELSAQAAAILHTALDRAGVAWQPGWSTTLQRPGFPPVTVELGERPPLVDVGAYRRRTA